MGFVKTAAEIAALEAALSAPRFVNSEMLSVVVDSDPDYLRSILPPPLRLADGSVRFMVGRWQSNCVGDYAGGAVYLPASFRTDSGDRVDGEYVLAMYMDGDIPIALGRDLFGEPKKQCRTSLNQGDGRATGWVERGVRLFELEGNFDTDHGPTTTTGANFNIKSSPSCTGVGLEGDAVVTLAEFDVTLTGHRTGSGAVAVQGTVHDPLSDIPIGAVRQAIWQAGDLVPTARRIATIPADVFVPYHHGRNDDWTALDTERRQLTPA